jgi:hypothetical protein
MQRVLKRLQAVHQKLLTTIDPLAPEVFSLRPADNQWSVAEIVHHLCLVEERVIEELKAASARPPQRLGVIRKLIPVSVVSLRLVRVKAPRAVKPVNAPEKQIVVEKFNRIRASLNEFCATQDVARLRQVIFKHPFLGSINGVKAISFIGYHEQRHLKQIREVLRKVA